MIETARAALLLVDVQNDFCAGGSLEVPKADRVFSPINRYITEALNHHMPVYASRDWHPAVSSHFKPWGGPWPPHCVQGTPGARFHPDIHLPSTAILISKGEDFASSGYSDLEGHTPDGTPFLEDLRARGISHLYVGGIATEYCVRHTVLDALAAGLHVTVLPDAIVGLDAEDSERALVEMLEGGAQFAAGPSCFAAPIDDR
jgi:nicotinamidase/pyrazinamidase